MYYEPAAAAAINLISNIRGAVINAQKTNTALQQLPIYLYSCLCTIPRMQCRCICCRGTSVQLSYYVSRVLYLSMFLLATYELALPLRSIHALFFLDARTVKSLSSLAVLIFVNRLFITTSCSVDLFFS